MALTIQEEIENESLDVEERVRTALAVAIGVVRKPEGDFDEDGIWRPSVRELAGETASYRAAPGVELDPMGMRRMKIWTSHAHCRKLVDRFFDGKDVPFDVADVCRNRAERIREDELQSTVSKALRREKERQKHAHADKIDAELARLKREREAFEASPAGKLRKAEEWKAELEAKKLEAKKSYEAHVKGLNTRIARVNRSIGQLKRQLK